MLGVVVPFWNPFGNRDRLDNLERCLSILRASPGVRALCVELVGDYRSGMADVELTGESRSVYIWQKERLVNHGCTMLAGQGVDFLGYVDSDCLFVGQGWDARILEQFDKGCNVVQGFCRAIGEDHAVPAALAAFPAMGDRLHGGSMFLHRELFQDVGGFYEYCIVGGGDHALMMAVTADFRNASWIFPGEAHREHASRWLDAFRHIDVRAACADNAIVILDHGNPNRSHRLRHVLLQDFIPEEDVVGSAVLEFTERGTRLLPRLRAYAAHRENRPDVIARVDRGA